MYAAAAGSAMAFSTSSATADIFYSGIQNVTRSAPLNEPLAITPIFIGGKRFDLWAEAHRLSFGSAYFGIHLRLFSGFAAFSPAGYGAGVLPERLSKGATISRGTTSSRAHRFLYGSGRAGDWFVLNGGFTYRFTNSSHQVRTAHSQQGQFAIGQPGFVGIQLATANGHRFDYGWIQLDVVGTEGSDGFPELVTAIDWAYNEVPGAPIYAGETPEPGGRSLALLAAGCIGILAWRKRRAQRAA
jgi:hypothetical protein